MRASSGYQQDFPLLGRLHSAAQLQLMLCFCLVSLAWALWLLLWLYRPCHWPCSDWCLLHLPWLPEPVSALPLGVWPHGYLFPCLDSRPRQFPKERALWYTQMFKCNRNWAHTIISTYYTHIYVYANIHHLLIYSFEKVTHMWLRSDDAHSYTEKKISFPSMTTGVPVPHFRENHCSWVLYFTHSPRNIICI